VRQRRPEGSCCKKSSSTEQNEDAADPTHHFMGVQFLATFVPCTNESCTKIRAVPKMPGRVPKELEEQTPTFVREDPPYGPERTEAELTSVGHPGIYNTLKKRCLTTAKARLEWVRKSSGEIITQDERTREKEKAKNTHVEAIYPDQLIGQNTFYIQCLKGRGRISHHVAGDCFSSFGAANVDDNKATRVSTDVVENYLAKKFAPRHWKVAYRCCCCFG